MKLFRATAMSRGFDITEVRTDQGSELAAMKPELDTLGSPLEVAGPGQHVGAGEARHPRSGRASTRARERPAVRHGQGTADYVRSVLRCNINHQSSSWEWMGTTSARTRSSRA